MFLNIRKWFTFYCGLNHLHNFFGRALDSNNISNLSLSSFVFIDEVENL